MRVEVKIEGVTPLLCNAFTDAAAEAATNGTRGSSANADRGTPQEQAASKLYLGVDGQPIIPQPNLMRCLVEGGRFHKIGKTQVTTSKSSILYGCMDVDGPVIDIEHEQPWRVDQRPVRNPSTGGRLLTNRPCFDDWALSFTLLIDESIISPKLVRQIIDDAGQRIGLGDFRPACKGPFGRFKVTLWQPKAEMKAVA